jgi:hypothetical protein
MKIDRVTRQLINNRLFTLCKGYKRQIPLGDIFDACKENGVMPIDDDGRKWAGLLCGREGRTLIDLAAIATAKKDGDDIVYTPADNAVLSLAWYKMEISGNYETVAYIS